VKRNVETCNRKSEFEPVNRRVELRQSFILWASITALLLSPAALRAEPLVVGFERFHSAAPGVDGGRLLYNELGCANCHSGESGLPRRRGPELAGIGQRVQPGWLRDYLAAPSAAREGTGMPHLLPDAAAAEAVMHYLTSLKPKAAVKARVIRHVNGDRGRDLFQTVGCAACHAPGGGYQPPEGAPKPADFTHRPVSFPRLKEKYVLSTLADFVRDPLKVRADGRMPRTEMEDQDAIDIAGYLLDHQGSDGTIAPKIEPLSADKALVDRGRAHVVALRCAACHELLKDVAVQPVALKRTDGGCLANAPAPGVPRYELSAKQQLALKSFLAQRSQPVSASQLASLTLEALNCTACHDRDGHGGPDPARKAYFQGDHNLGDTGRYPPPLTGVGRKLQPAWLAKVLTGEARVRPYLKTQMPIYGEATAALSALLSKADSKPEQGLPAGDVEAGRKLLGTLGGVSCITCHRWKERASLGIQGLDLSNLAQRIQPGWLHEYLPNPAVYRAGTLMPSFWPDGKAANTEVLGGDTAKQIASIYAFAVSGKGEPEGYPAHTAGQFEIIPREHPVVQRAFMQGSGTHTILVGFPAGVHLAYDGRHARPALAWKGRFFDAYSTWFSRFAPFEKPLGDSLVRWPEVSPGDPDVRFEGYRLDAQGVPTFLWIAGGVQVRERYEPVADGLRRILTWDLPAANLRPIEHPQGVNVVEDSASPRGQRSFTYSWK
jgi:cytochrome c553